MPLEDTKSIELHIQGLKELKQICHTCETDLKHKLLNLEPIENNTQEANAIINTLQSKNTKQLLYLIQNHFGMIYHLSIKNKIKIIDGTALIEFLIILINRWKNGSLDKTQTKVIMHMIVNDSLSCLSGENIYNSIDDFFLLYIKEIVTIKIVNILERVDLNNLVNTLLASIHLNYQDKNGNTALHILASHNCPEEIQEIKNVYEEQILKICRVLLKKGADYTKQNANNETAIELMSISYLERLVSSYNDDIFMPNDFKLHLIRRAYLKNDVDRVLILLKISDISNLIAPATEELLDFISDNLSNNNIATLIKAFKNKQLHEILKIFITAHTRKPEQYNEINKKIAEYLITANFSAPSKDIQSLNIFAKMNFIATFGGESINYFQEPNLILYCVNTISIDPDATPPLETAAINNNYKMIIDAINCVKNIDITKNTAFKPFGAACSKAINILVANAKTGNELLLLVAATNQSSRGLYYYKHTTITPEIRNSLIHAIKDKLQTEPSFYTDSFKAHGIKKPMPPQALPRNRKSVSCTIS